MTTLEHDATRSRRSPSGPGSPPTRCATTSARAACSTPVDRASSTPPPLHRGRTSPGCTFLTKLRATAMPIADDPRLHRPRARGRRPTAARLELLLRAPRSPCWRQLAEMQRVARPPSTSRSPSTKRRSQHDEAHHTRHPRRLAASASAAWGCRRSTPAPERTRRNRSAPSTAPSTSASPSSTPPRSTGPTSTRSCSARRSGDRRDEVVVATKFGTILHRGDGPAASTAAPRTCGSRSRDRCSASAPTTSTSTTSTAWIPAVPIEETVGALAELIDEGKIGHYGLSEAAPEHDPPRPRRAPGHRRADRVLALVARPRGRDPAAVLRELGIGFVPYSPLGRGFLTGAIRSVDQLDADRLPAQQPAIRGREPRREPRASSTPSSRWPPRSDATPAQVALAWLLAQGDDIAPDPRNQARVAGSRRTPARMRVELTAAQLSTLNDAPGTGRRPLCGHDTAQSVADRRHLCRQSGAAARNVERGGFEAYVSSGRAPRTREVSTWTRNAFTDSDAAIAQRVFRRLRWSSHPRCGRRGPLRRRRCVSPSAAAARRRRSRSAVRPSTSVTGASTT